MPSKNHAIVQTNLILALSKIAADLSVLSELTIDLETGPLTPDICVYPELEVDWIHDEIRMSDLPLLVVEILSPKQYLSDLVEKLELYFAAGVKSGWLVQPSLKSIAVFTPDMTSTVYTAGELTDPALGITINLDDIFG
ncbi:MAG: Uma2 family endonuclease [Anaerolineae bacterium]|nr:Uma2 family endonuclease [Anaerolineae bacterium]